MTMRTQISDNLLKSMSLNLDGCSKGKSLPRITQVIELRAWSLHQQLRRIQTPVNRVLAAPSPVLLICRSLRAKRICECWNTMRSFIWASSAKNRKRRNVTIGSSFRGLKSDCFTRRSSSSKSSLKKDLKSNTSSGLKNKTYKFRKYSRVPPKLKTTSLLWRVICRLRLST